MLLVCTCCCRSERARQQSQYIYIYVGKNLDFTFSALHYGTSRFYHNGTRSVALKCTCVVAVWSFEMHAVCHCFDFREDRARFQVEKFRRFSDEFFMIMLIFQQYLLMFSTYYIVDHVYVC